MGNVLVKLLQRDKTNRIYIEKETSYEKLSHMIVETEKSQIYHLQVGDPWALVVQIPV